MRPRLWGAATERCDTRTTRGSWRGSYRPGRIRKPAGDRFLPPARDTGNQIPRTQPGKNAAEGPGNRYPGTGQQRPATRVTVLQHVAKERPIRVGVAAVHDHVSAGDHHVTIRRDEFGAPRWSPRLSPCPAPPPPLP